MTRRRVTPEEKALWRRATSAVRPLSPSNAQQSKDEHNEESRHALNRKPASTMESKSARRNASPPKAHIVARSARLADPFTAGDPKAERLVRRGKRPIDAVFDLHGHTQSSARAALYGFLLEARARNHACVLIITGKGVRLGVGNDAPRVGGVLRARFQDWMREDAFRQHVTRVSKAHDRHGGGGAFYIFLKRNK